MIGFVPATTFLPAQEQQTWTRGARKTLEQAPPNLRKQYDIQIKRFLDPSSAEAQYVICAANAMIESDRCSLASMIESCPSLPSYLGRVSYLSPAVVMSRLPSLSCILSHLLSNCSLSLSNLLLFLIPFPLSTHALSLLILYLPCVLFLTTSSCSFSHPFTNCSFSSSCPPLPLILLPTTSSLLSSLSLSPDT